MKSIIVICGIILYCGNVYATIDYNNQNQRVDMDRRILEKPQPRPLTTEELFGKDAKIEKPKHNDTPELKPKFDPTKPYKIIGGGLDLSQYKRKELLPSYDEIMKAQKKELPVEEPSQLEAGLRGALQGVSLGLTDDYTTAFDTHRYAYRFGEFVGVIPYLAILYLIMRRPIKLLFVVFSGVENYLINWSNRQKTKNTKTL